VICGRYVVLNKTRKAPLSSATEMAETVSQRMKGLIGRTAREFAPGNGLWIVPSNWIHTLGMSFPIDAAYLDSKGRIVKLYHGLAPFRIAAMKLKARSVLELPAGTLAKTHTKVGDILEFYRSDEAFENSKEALLKGC
jgi:uncharacterized membrane protein (UPF0127 family)